MVTTDGGITDKKALMKFLYSNPEKMAIKLAQFLKDKEGNALPVVRLKGEGQGYYYSFNDKKLVRVCRNAEFYLLSWHDVSDPEKCFIYTHHNWMTGLVLRVNKSEIINIGGN